MYRQNRIDLALYRMEKAERCLKEARDNVNLLNYETAANRSYYALFNAMRSLLNLDGKDFKRHSGVISEFRRDFIKTGILPAELSGMIRDAFNVRNASDYENFYVISKEKVEEQVMNATIFVEAVKHCLMERIESPAEG